MKVELRNVRHHPRKTRETTCFEADLFIDGKARGEVYNEGCGGCHCYTDRSLYGEKDFDHLVDEQLMDALHREDLKKLLSKKLLFVRDGKLLGCALRKDETYAMTAKKVCKPTDAVLNDAAFDEAYALYRKHAQ